MTAHFDPRKVPFIEGAGGGGKGGGGGSEEAANTLRSKARAHIIDLISEGEIEGLVAGQKSIYFDETPVENVSGSLNYEGVTWEERVGLPDQPHFQGNNKVETTNSVETEVRFELPVTRTITEQNADAVRVIIRIPGLLEQDNESGDMNPASVSYAIDLRPYGGTWTEVVRRDIVNQKTTSAYQRQELVELPETGHPWDIRVRRLTEDSDSVYLQNETWWESYVVIVRGKFIYPNSAMVATDLDAELMGESIPERAYHVRGLIIEVPSNYDPIARSYTGIWDGTFKRAWTNNPAWIFRDILANDRYGLGEFVDAAKIDKWGLYQIAQYCDELVPSGYKDVDGNEVMEPRFLFNGVINSREEAHRVIQNIVATFRGMAFWSYGQVFAVADIPSDPVKLVSPANVIDGKFEYSGTGMKARHSVALVTWNDPLDFFRQATEVVINDEMLLRFGWRETRVEGHGITSRGQAHRFGKWMLDTEQHETETVTYEASWDHAEVRPGDIIAVADPAKAQVRSGGRIASYAAAGVATVTLDSVFEPVAGETYQLMAELPDGGIDTAVIANWEVIDGRTRVTLESGFSQAPIVGAMWVITGTEIRPRTYRVVAVKETEQHLFQVTALFHDPTKYARVEQGIQFEEPGYTRPRNFVSAPSNLSVVETQYYRNGVPRSRVNLSWTPSEEFRNIGYDVEVEGPDGTRDLGRTTDVSMVIDDVQAGTYTFRVRAVNRMSLRSPAAELTYQARGWENITEPYVSGLIIKNSPDGNTFEGPSVVIEWNNVFPAGGADFVTGTTNEQNNPFYDGNVVEVYDVLTGNLLRSEIVYGHDYTYSFDANKLDNAAHNSEPTRHLRFEVTVRDVNGNESAKTVITAQNPVPATVIPTGTGLVQAIHVSWQPPADLDYAGVKVWISTVSGFNPATTSPYWTGAGNSITVEALPGQKYFVRVAAYDRFGQSDLNISPQIEVEPKAVDIDVDPPAVPSGLTLTTRVDTKNGMAQRLMLIATVNAHADEGFAYFDYSIRQGSGNFVSFNSSSNVHEWAVMPQQAYTVRVRAVDQFGNPSNFGPWQSITTPAVSGLAAVINAGTTTIDPGKILVSGGTTLADWRRGGDETKIDGGAVSANTIEANKLTIGQRGLAIEGIEFQANKPSTNTVSWSAGTIRYTGDDGNIATRTISAGSANWSSGTLFLYFQKGGSTISATTNATVAFSANAVVLAAYRGDLDLTTNYGRTIIDGSKIVTGSITTNQLRANSISADKLAASAVTAEKIAAGAVTAGKLAANSITADNIQVDTIVTNHLVDNSVSTNGFAQSTGIAGANYTWIDLATIVNENNDGFIMAWLEGKLAADWRSSYNYGGTGSVEILRNDVVLRTIPMVFSSVYSEAFNQYLNRLEVDANNRTLDPAPGQGLVTYKARARFDIHFAASAITYNITDQTMIVVGLKR